MADVVCVVRGYSDVNVELLIGNMEQCQFQIHLTYFSTLNIQK